MRYKVFIAIAAVGAVALLAYVYLQTRAYYPVVNVDLPDGLTLTAVLKETKELGACKAANERFVTPFAQCKACKVRSTRCERGLDGIELALKQGDPLPHPVVVAPHARLVIMGPPDLAKASCQVAAAQMAAKGIKSAACMPAQPATAKSSEAKGG